MPNGFDRDIDRRSTLSPGLVRLRLPCRAIECPRRVTNSCHACPLDSTCSRDRILEVSSRLFHRELDIVEHRGVEEIVDVCARPSWTPSSREDDRLR